MTDAPDKESKTEEATEKRRDESLDEGNTPISREFSHLGFVFGLIAAGTWMVLGVTSQISGVLTTFLERPDEFKLENAADVSMLLHAVAIELAPFLAPVALLFLATGILFQAVQSPVRASWKRIAPKASRISISAGWKRLASVLGLVDLLKGIAKIGFLGAIAILYLTTPDESLLLSVDMPATALPSMMIAACVKVLIPVCIGVSALAALDVVYSRFSWERRMRMTLQEVRDEVKQSEGDQLLSRQRRSIARNRLRQMAIQNVPRATLVITNPTHFAVALRYVRSEGGAPTVVAKGQDLLALQIRKIAVEKEIAIIEDKALARSLYAAVEINQPIPREFFAAVANVIMTLRKLGNRQILSSLEA